MKLTTWNIRGLNKTKSALIAVLEHKVKEGNIKKVVNKVAPGWNYCHNLNLSNNGRILIIWNPAMMHFTVSDISSQYIHGVISIPRLGWNSKATFVYGLHTIDDRVNLRMKLTAKGNTMQEAWICKGDFNALLAVNDRLRGNPVHDIEIKDFNEFLLDISTTVLKSVGS
ncbi:hypothetical protein P3L10_018781 [Capsicum annuum]